MRRNAPEKIHVYVCPCLFSFFFIIKKAQQKKERKEEEKKTKRIPGQDLITRLIFSGPTRILSLTSPQLLQSQS
jgi:hypothetical protein